MTQLYCHTAVKSLPTLLTKRQNQITSTVWQEHIWKRKYTKCGTVSLAGDWKLGMVKLQLNTMKTPLESKEKNPGKQQARLKESKLF